MPRVKRKLPALDLGQVLSEVEVDRGQAIGPQIYDVLRRLIVSSRLPSGAPLHENDIAVACRISRTPVRAALRQLVLEGLVTTWPQVGSVVASIDRGQIEEGVIIRRALEGEIVRLLALRPPQDWRRIDDLLVLQEEAVATGNDLAFFTADEQFHAALADMAGAPAAWRLVQSARPISTACACWRRATSPAATTRPIGSISPSSPPCARGTWRRRAGRWPAMWKAC